MFTVASKTKYSGIKLMKMYFKKKCEIYQTLMGVSKEDLNKLTDKPCLFENSVWLGCQFSTIVVQI